MTLNWTKFLVAATLIAGGGVMFVRSGDDKSQTNSVSSSIVDLSVPALSPLASIGQALFNDNCSSCHGENGKGTEMGPPLIHPIYKPSHHADMSFVLAVSNGVRRHHWPYGDMPSQPHVSRDEVQKIIGFVREMQEANGILN